MDVFNSLWDHLKKKLDHRLIVTFEKVLSTSQIHELGVVLMLVLSCYYSEMTHLNLDQVTMICHATNFINIGFKIHDLSTDSSSNPEPVKNFKKLIVICGDLFFSIACRIVSDIGIPSVVGVFSHIIGQTSSLLVESKRSKEQKTEMEGYRQFIKKRYADIVTLSLSACLRVFNEGDMDINDEVKNFIIYSINCSCLSHAVSQMKDRTRVQGIVPLIDVYHSYPDSTLPGFIISDCQIFFDYYKYKLLKHVKLNIPNTESLVHVYLNDLDPRNLKI
ncbi:hypothetical protein RF11_07325 [Thelohanellus kitauei]|uniref:Uncharacterized protein n=1 Tax=Thelohanellus kitauei TaxID=669202 RepID=A0A0C2JEP7_THEKT|nr:hypothetical protein RF11_07325 [Thelohanellus kitauei]